MRRIKAPVDTVTKDILAQVLAAQGRLQNQYEVEKEERDAKELLMQKELQQLRAINRQPKRLHISSSESDESSQVFIYLSLVFKYFFVLF